MTEKESKKGKKRTGKLLSSFVVLTIVLSVLAVSVAPVIADVPPPPPDITSITATANPESIEAKGVATSLITASALKDSTPASGYTLTFEIIGGPADVVLVDADPSGRVYILTDAAGEANATLRAGTTEGIATVKAFYSGQAEVISDTADVHLYIEYKPDLNVTEITPNCDYLFGNESNEICAVIKNIGPEAADAFNVSFVVDGFSDKVRVNGLDASASTTKCVIYPTSRNAGDLVSINVTADCDHEINESSETDNWMNISKTVVNNGYKGKRYTGGEDIETEQIDMYFNGSILYSVGDSYYLSGSTPWDTYTANWTVSDLPVPTGATIEKARLYVMYTWDKVQGMPDNVSMTFNGNLKTRDAFYTDRKGYGSWDYPYGMLAYDVTGDFNASSINTAVLGNLNPVAGNPSIRGMLLVVIYADESESECEILFMNEGFDLLYGGSDQCTTPEEATAYAPFAWGTIEIEDVANKSARLITVAPGAGPNEGELIFNGNVWNNVWNFAGATQIGIDDRYVTSYLLAEDNEAAFQSSADYMEASIAILVVREKLEKEFTIDFVTGYNMISMPLNDTSVTNASLLLAKIGANCTGIFKWNTTTPGWESYHPSTPPAAAFNIVGGEGYFVSMNGPETVVFKGMGWESPFSMSLVTGYNMIGIPVNDTSVTNASLLLAKIGANCTEIFKWNTATQGWESYNPSKPPAAAFNIGCGEGYFVSMVGPADVTFVGEPCQD